MATRRALNQARARALQWRISEDSPETLDLPIPTGYVMFRKNSNHGKGLLLYL